LQFINDKYVPKFESQVREAEKKVLLLMGGPLRGGRVVKAGPLRKKELFMNFYFYFVTTPMNPGGK